jgi:hypothetical protein
MKLPKWLSNIFASNDAMLPFVLAILEFGTAMGLFSRDQGMTVRSLGLTLKDVTMGTIFLCLALIMLGIGVLTVAKRFRTRQVSDFRKV